MTIKAILPAILALGLGLAGAAQAQNAATTPAAPVVSGSGSATNNAVNTAPANNSGAPVAGANSFTEGQARERISGQGLQLRSPTLRSTAKGSGAARA